MHLNLKQVVAEIVTNVLKRTYPDSIDAAIEHVHERIVKLLVRVQGTPKDNAKYINGVARNEALRFAQSPKLKLKTLLESKHHDSSNKI